MAAKLYKAELPPEILARGFWLYAWKIVGPKSQQLCYVGMTGDVTGVAQSPFARAGSHFGSNKNANAVRRHLSALEIEPELCNSIQFLVYGPVFPYLHSKPRHPDFDAHRNAVAALERKLWEVVQQAGQTMLNTKPHSKRRPDQAKWDGVWKAFAPYF
jgi:hypothetical protein